MHPLPIMVCSLQQPTAYLPLPLNATTAILLQIWHVMQANEADNFINTGPSVPVTTVADYTCPRLQQQGFFFKIGTCCRPMRLTMLSTLDFYASHSCS